MVTGAVFPMTDFSRDILGRYVCNSLDEALRSADASVMRPPPDERPQIEARDFDIIIIGGGTSVECSRSTSRSEIAHAIIEYSCSKVDR
jgi:hypothetical protein